jgi:hypothetical protein
MAAKKRKMHKMNRRNDRGIGRGMMVRGIISNNCLFFIPLTTLPLPPLPCFSFMLALVEADRSAPFRGCLLVDHPAASSA